VQPTSHLWCAFSATRQAHVGGEKVFVDFAGDTIDVIDPATGEARAMKLFVAASRQRRACGTMGASHYTYAEAVASEGLEDWILAHIRMFAFPGGVAKAIVPDNPKSAVIRADRFDPGAEQNIRRDGRALWHRHSVRPATQTPGQGEGGSRRPGGATLDSGMVAEPSVLLIGRTERGDPAASG